MLTVKEGHVCIKSIKKDIVTSICAQSISYILIYAKSVYSGYNAKMQLLGIIHKKWIRKPELVSDENIF